VKIALTSYRFPPDFGGIESVSLLLAEQLSARGHEVVVITSTAPPEKQAETPYRVLYSPTRGQLWKAFSKADVVFQNNISVNLAWPAWLQRKPQAIIHQTWIFEPQGQPTRVARAKQLLARPCEQIAISQPIAKQWPGCTRVWGNPYDSAVYRNLGGERPHDLIFVGRLVRGKGCDHLLEALARPGIRANRLTIVGDGPARSELEQQAASLGLGNLVYFAGRMDREEIAHTLNQHRVLVVPSEWQEPFGIVATEGAACGCAVIGTQGGGLPDAIGRGGLLVPNRDVDALSAAIRQLLDDPVQLAGLAALAVEDARRFELQTYVDQVERLLSAMAGN